MDKTTFANLTQSKRILMNAMTLLQNGLFTGQNSEAITECQKFIADLYNQTAKQLEEALNDKLDRSNTTAASKETNEIEAA